MLITSKAPSNRGSNPQKPKSSYVLVGVVREGDIFWWPDQPLQLDLSRATRLVSGTAEAILRAAGQVVVEVIAREGSVGLEAVKETPLFDHLRASSIPGIYEVLP